MAFRLSWAVTSLPRKTWVHPSRSLCSCLQQASSGLWDFWPPTGSNGAWWLHDARRCQVMDDWWLINDSTNGDIWHVHSGCLYYLSSLCRLWNDMLHHSPEFCLWTYVFILVWQALLLVDPLDNVPRHLSAHLLLGFSECYQWSACLSSVSLPCTSSWPVLHICLGDIWFDECLVESRLWLLQFDLVSLLVEFLNVYAFNSPLQLDLVGAPNEFIQWLSSFSSP